jgi:hypothetical protein
MRQIAFGVLQYYDAHEGQFFLHHPFDADVIANTHDGFAWFSQSEREYVRLCRNQVAEYALVLFFELERRLRA